MYSELYLERASNYLIVIGKIKEEQLFFLSGLLKLAYDSINILINKNPSYKVG